MKKKNLLLQLCGAMLLVSSAMSAQEYRKITQPNSAFQDVNDNGVAVGFGLMYDWTTKVVTPKESVVYRLRSINNNGDMTAGVTVGAQKVASYKLNGSNSWTSIPLPPNTINSTLYTEGVPYQISENGKYIVGSMGLFDNQLQKDIVIPFIFDTTTGVTSRASNSDFVDGTFLTVNNAGDTAGWIDIPLTSTRRVPTLYSNSGVFKYIKNNSGNLPQVINNEVKAINNNGVAVGQFDNLPFIYDPATDTYTEFANPNPTKYFGGAFSSISEDGTIVGMWYTAGQSNRFATIYHPNLGTTPLDLKAYLESRGVTVQSGGTANNMGPALAISPNGKFIIGFEDGPAVVAYGWIVNIPELVLANNEVEASKLTVNVYPNPVIDDINIDLRTSKAGVAKVELYSLDGKLIKSENKNLSNGINHINVNVAQAAKGTKNLILVINTPEGNRISKKLVIK
ncbi:Por secretion system C-terminal sorting domain-containing protein [Soonwooa buanensis]|uniref:Por secretion system C-terminal sorting domain-containing protein n=1 Tax=Soonwooa buanensis TaxID=619805 RepID=A0A1T5F453_9FLAO|nr:T9SS type A sorting domain-containing protein [Soonwooa buanensis]SKB90919.1 Por secretion system C-terminal sorting domain-containing protein [Soonwooa buanensis]